MKPHIVTEKDTRAIVLTLRYQLYKGLAARVAKELGVERSTVSRVIKGTDRSRRIEAALQREMRRIERQIEKEVAA